METKVQNSGNNLPDTNFNTFLNNIFEMNQGADLEGFVSLTERLAAKQKELDIMATDTKVAAILSDYLSDVLLPNSNGDLISIIPKDLKAQPILESIYKRLNIPLDKATYSLLTKGIVIAEFEQASITNVAEKTIKEHSATESIEGTGKASTEQTYIRKAGTILPSISIVHDAYTVFPVIRKETCVSYIEVKKSVIGDSNFDWESAIVSYEDVIIHPPMDYAYEIYGVRRSSKPLRLTVKGKDGELVSYELASGCSMLEDSYAAWKTLSLLEDSIVLASLIKNAQIMLVETEAGGATDAQIEAAKIKLRSLFEGQLALGSNGMRSYLNPQAKPAYIYSFTNNGVGKISTNIIGGEYNPGQLYYLTPFVNQFFSGMNYPKQRAGFTEGAGGLDGGGAVEEYTKRYNSTVARLKRGLGSFIKKCINNVLAAKNLYKLVDEFEVVVYGAYNEESLQEIQLQQTKLQFYESVIAFSGITDEIKQRKLRSILIKQVITTKSITEEIDRLLLEEDKEEDDPPNDKTELGEDTQIPDDLLSDLGLEEEQPEERQDSSSELPDMENVLDNTGEDDG